MALAYPFLYHPCWTMNRTTLWERIHLPIAKKCNLRCNYCDTLSNTCHSIGPGSSVRSFTVDEAWEILTRELSKRRNLHIVGISGPGEPLHNHETFEFLEKLSRFRPSMKVCISTNGILLSNSVETLADLGVDSLSISINAASPETASKLYGVPSIERSAEVIRNQLDGIQKAREFCIPVKVNTILVPGVNSEELEEIAKKISEAGALLQNIVPLVPRGSMSNHRPPTMDEIRNARIQASKHITQFIHCMQCRSDVVGIPGMDSVLSLN